MIKTYAKKNSDGTYSITGNKIFITNGGGGLAFVLAKVKNEDGSVGTGLDSISMFFVEKKIASKNNFRIGKLEEKMGLHGSLTCEVIFENSVGHLCGEVGHGFKYMLHLMNEARIAVAIQALGGIEGALSYAHHYAGERVQFDRVLKDLPLMKRNLDDMQTETDAIRCLIVDTISHFEAYTKLDLKRKLGEKLSVSEESLFKASQIWTRKRTPLVKYYACEKFTDISKQCIQVLGGYGFMQEYPVERYHRDSFGPLIYEGTSQIQALMVLKDTVKHSMKNPKKLITGLITAHPSGQLLSDQWDQEFYRIHYKTKKNLLKLFIKTLKPTDPKKVFNPKNWTGIENVSRLMIHAETICQALCYIETLRVLKDHCHLDVSRFELFKRYKILVAPRLAGLYKDWELRE
jgi:hypothetical protein